jgi:hypothetical protein
MCLIYKHVLIRVTFAPFLSEAYNKKGARHDAANASAAREDLMNIQARSWHGNELRGN